ncbi:MAG TPA: DUF5655 domain-containing protein [Polyangiaceae bacterium]|nr:DUF5655 domain-containing protein [Polyangiaceae bacterium]
MKMTERSARWMETVVANCKPNTGRTLAEWTRLARTARLKDARGARAWAKAQGLSIVYATALVDQLFPASAGDDALVDAQYSGAKAPLRPIYEAVVGAARRLGPDVAVMPRRSQVTLSRATTFAVVRAGAKDRVDVALKLHGEGATPRLIADPKAAGPDPSHVVALQSRKDVDRAFVGWLRKAYERAGR